MEQVIHFATKNISTYRVNILLKRVCSCVLSVGVLVTCSSYYAQANTGFTQPNPAQWSHTRPFRTIKVLVQ